MKVFIYKGNEYLVCNPCIILKRFFSTNGDIELTCGPVSSLSKALSIFPHSTVVYMQKRNQASCIISSHGIEITDIQITQLKEIYFNILLVPYFYKIQPAVVQLLTNGYSEPIKDKFSMHVSQPFALILFLQISPSVNSLIQRVSLLKNIISNIIENTSEEMNINHLLIWVTELHLKIRSNMIVSNCTSFYESLLSKLESHLQPDSFLSQIDIPRSLPHYCAVHLSHIAATFPQVLSVDIGKPFALLNYEAKGITQTGSNSLLFIVFM